MHIAGYEWLDWDVHLDVILICVLLEGAFLYAVTQMRSQFPGAGPVKRSQVVLFSLGVFSIYVAAGSPLHDLAENYLASAHMIQHVLLTLVAAPLLLAGVPGWLWQALLKTPGMMRIAKPLTQPVVAFALFNAALLLIHLPQTIDLQLREHSFHLFVHAALVGTALLMWWPILSPIPELPRLNPPMQMAYLFLQSLLPAVMASFITFADTVVYDFYADAPRIWHMTALDDQQLAGGSMKLMATIILWSYMTVVFFRWYFQEERAESEAQRDDVKAELGLQGR
ncbi:MAG: cytochrome c oxidase assembly protein [Chloroflexi bacterium]|nr:cytochrome c oxidase assembly protein [Chloroflexota bacterium]